MNNIKTKYPINTFDKIRYGDTDRQGHVNNAIFNQYFETGRVEFLYDKKLKLLKPEASFVIVSANINYKKEIKWPGTVEIGSGISKIGNSSITIHQVLFQNQIEVASCIAVIVQVDKNGKSLALSKSSKAKLNKYLLK